MSSCRFMYRNFVPGPQDLKVSSARPGMVCSPAAEALGSAVCLAAGEHTGALDQVLVVEIDSLAAGDEVGLATFRWKREGAGSWEATGVPTSVRQIPLADGVSVKWVPGPDQNFYKGDRWSILATGCQGPQALMDRDRDTAWRSLSPTGQRLEVDLGQAQTVRAMVLADHNLTGGATATLKGTDTPEPSAPIWRFDPAGGVLMNDAGVAGTNSRATGRTYIDGGVLKYAEAGESCFEDGLLSIEPEATNLLPYSNDFRAAVGWNPSGVVVVPNSTKAPDGTNTGHLIYPTAPTPHRFLYYPTLGLGLPPDTDYTESLFIKQAGKTWAYLRFEDKANLPYYAYFNLATGEVGTVPPGVSAKMTHVVDGWYRCTVTGNTGVGAGGSNPWLVGGCDADGNTFETVNGTDGIYIWGAQLEAGTVPTAYIPTTSSPGYRAKDDIYWVLPQDLKNIMSAEEPAPTAVLDQSAGDIVLSTVAGGAFVMPDDGSGADLSPYADGQHVLKIVDSAGKVAWARIGAAGTGETLSAELLENGTFAGAWGAINAPDGWTIVGAPDVDSYLESDDVNDRLRIVSNGSIMGVSQDVLDAGALYKYTVGIYSVASGTLKINLGGAERVFSSPGTYQGYLPSPQGGGYVFYRNTACDVTASSASAKRVTAPAVNGVWLESTQGAADKTWSYVNSGFNPNSVAEWAVYPANQWRAEGTLVVRGWVAPTDYDEVSPGYKGLVSIADTLTSILYGINTNRYLVSWDGTSDALITFPFVANTPYDIAVRWSSDVNQKQLGYKLSSASAWIYGNEAAFDGSFALGNYLRLGYSAPYPFKIGTIEFYDHQLEAPLEKSLEPWEHPDYSQALTITSPHLVCFLEQSLRYWRLELDDPDNPQGSLQASLFYLGDSFAPQRTFRAGYGQGSVATRKVVVSGGGKAAGSGGALTAYYQLEFARLAPGDVAELEEMLAVVHGDGEGGLRPMFFTPFISDPDQTLYCLPGAELSRQRAPGGRWNLGLRLDEVIKSHA